MNYINGQLAKDITRTAVTNLYYEFAANQKSIYVQSLPGDLWQFEKDVLASSAQFGKDEFYLECFEKNAEVYYSNLIRRENLIGNDNMIYHRDVFSNPEDKLRDGQSYFAWKDYCGLPTQDIIDDLYFPNDRKSLQIFTFATIWRIEDSIPYRLYCLKQKYGAAKAMILYFAKIASQHGYRLFFKCKYRSRKTPMIIFGITNDSSIMRMPSIISEMQIKLELGCLPNNKLNAIFPRQTIGNTKSLLSDSQKEEIYKSLKENTDDEVIMKQYNISKKRLGSFKAWITMGY